MGVSACQLCGKPLSRIRMLRDGDFCSREHREQHQLRRGMNRVLEASEVSLLERRKERPRLIDLRPPAFGGQTVRRPCPDPPGLGRRAYDCFLPALNVMANLRPAPAGVVPPASSRHAARAETVGRRAASGVAAVRRALVLRDYRPATRRQAPGVTIIAGPRAGAMPVSLAGTAPDRRPAPDRPAGRGVENPLFRPARLPQPADSGRRQLPAAQFQSRAPVAEEPYGPPDSAPRGAGQMRFPSGHTRGRPPIPMARRRIGAPARVSAPSFAAGRRPGAVFLPAQPRGFELQLRAAVALPVGLGRVEHRNVRLTGFSRPVEHAWAIDPAAPADRRSPTQAAFRRPVPEGRALQGFGLTAEGLGGMASAPPLPAPPLPSQLAARPRPATTPPPKHAACVPRRPVGIAGKSGTLAAAPAARAPLAMPVEAGAARARLCEPKRGLGRTGAEAAPPVLPPWTAIPARGFRPAPVAFEALPITLRAAAGAADRWSGAAPFLPQRPLHRSAPLGIQGAVTGLPGEAAPVIEDNFASGLGRWVGSLEDWRLDAAGVRVGSLALFAPSLMLRDYDLEFLAKIERRSVDWVVRASDFNNYWAIRILLEDQGEERRLELVRYAVVGGAADAPVRISAPVALRSKAAFRIQTSVKGADFKVSLEGRTIGRWNDPRLEAGGVGFLSEQQDRARLYWVKIERPMAGMRIH